MSPKLRETLKGLLHAVIAAVVSFFTARSV